MINKILTLAALLSLAWACTPTRPNTTATNQTDRGDNARMESPVEVRETTERPENTQRLERNGSDFRSMAPAAAPARPIELGEFQTLELDNGLTVIVVENRELPRVSYRLFVDVPAHLEGDYAGTAELAGTMFRRATANRTKAELDEAIDFLGATLSAGSSGGTVRGLSNQKEELMALLAETFLQARFPEEDLEVVRSEAKAGLQQALVTPEGIAGRLQSRLWYGDEHPYGELVTVESYDAIGTEQIQRYYDTYFVPNRSYLVMVGDLSKVEARQLAERYFGSWQAKDVTVTNYTTPRPPSGRRVSFVHRPGSVQSIIRIGHPVRLQSSDEDALAVNLVGSVLGSPFNGRLFKNLREDKGYTYGAYASISPDEEVGSMRAYADVRTEVTDSAVTEFLAEMERISRSQVSAEELARGRSQINGQLAQSMESPETISRFALNTVRYNLSEDHYETLVSRAEDLSALDLLEVARQYIRPDQAHILVVGDRTIADKLIPFASDGIIHFYDASGEPIKEDEPEPADDISVGEVIDRYLNAIGGREQLAQVERLKTVMGGNVQGMAMTQTNYLADNNKFASSIEAMGMVMMDQRYNEGEAKMSAQGQEVPLDDDMKAGFAEQAFLFPELMIESFDEYEIEAGETIDGQPTYAISREGSGMSQTDYYSRNTGLKVRTIIVAQGQTQTIDYGDYQEVEGIKFPHRMTMSGMAPFPIEMEISEIELNGEIDPAVFEVD